VSAVQDRLAYEAGVRRRQAVIAVVAGVLLMVAAGIVVSGPHTSVSELTTGLILEHKRYTRDLIGSFLEAFGWLAVASTLNFLFGCVRARNQAIQPYIRYLAIAGGVMTAIGVAGYVVVYGSKADTFFKDPTQTYEHANHLMSATILAVFQLFNYAGELLLAVSFVLISLNAMRVGLMTRFMGYLGMFAGVLVLFVLTPLPVVQAYWLIAVGCLFWGWWPTGLPPAWETGQAEKWPSSAELREQRSGGGGSGGGGVRGGLGRGARPKPTTTPEPVGAAAARGTRSTTPKRKRKRRK
jgi:hypothetical protein